MAFSFFVDREKRVLSSESRIYKTGAFIARTGHFAKADTFVGLLAGGLFLHAKNDTQFRAFIEKGVPFKLEIGEGEFTFFAVAASKIKQENLSGKDLVFYGFTERETTKRRNDQRIRLFIEHNREFAVKCGQVQEEDIDFSKLYSLSNTDSVNFPLLSAEQRTMVETEDKNVLVQGVAGSGKTNICVSKIVFAASRNYQGNLLYTTFSRGLLIETQEKLNAFKNLVIAFLQDKKEGKIVFIGDEKKAIENTLGIHLAGEGQQIYAKLQSIIDFLDTKVEFLLLEDLYKKYLGVRIETATESYFIRDYAGRLKNHQLAGKLAKISHLSYEVIYKEIYGMIYGCCNPEKPLELLAKEEYIKKRSESFSASDCEIIYNIAKDYYKFMEKAGRKDNNIISCELIANNLGVRYSLTVIDEVQDMTEVALYLLKSLSLKLFCVGDALQMINPTFFSFAYLKRLLFEKDITEVAALTHNYRNTQNIANVIEKLGQLNIKQFGTHSFVLKGVHSGGGESKEPVYINDGAIIPALQNKNTDNYTIIVATAKDKAALRKLLKAQEILTVSEIKGLERENVILFNLLSSNYDRWKAFERTLVNRKTADENSVYRYYFNLFYVGVSRAKSRLYIFEEKEINSFKDLFSTFEKDNSENAAEELASLTASFDEEAEALERIEQFLKLAQYDNAIFAADKLSDDAVRHYQLKHIEIYREHVSKGNYREAGIRYWELGRLEQTKRYFSLSGDESLIGLVDACYGESEKGLDIEIINYLPEVSANKAAVGLILETAEADLARLKERQKKLGQQLKSLWRKN